METHTEHVLHPRTGLIIVALAITSGFAALSVEAEWLKAILLIAPITVLVIAIIMAIAMGVKTVVVTVGLLKKLTIRFRHRYG